MIKVHKVEVNFKHTTFHTATLLVSTLRTVSVSVNMLSWSSAASLWQSEMI